MKKILQMLIFTAFSCKVSSQIVMGDPARFGTGTQAVCASGIPTTFLDPGGTGFYANNQDLILTFCPSVPGEKVKITFTAWNIESGTTTTNCNDFLDIWYGTQADAYNTIPYAQLCGTNTTGQTRTFLSSSPSGCITFRFRSNASVTRSGWTANISCVKPCQNPLANLSGPSIVNICPASSLNPGNSTLSFDAGGSVYNPGSATALSKYIWSWGDGQTETTLLPKATHTYVSPGIYIVSLIVADNNFTADSLGCKSVNDASKTIHIMPNPAFTGSSPGQINTDCNSKITLNGIVTSQTISRRLPNPKNGVALIDASGAVYISRLDMSGYFPKDAKLTADCYPKVKFNIEHSWTRDLLIELVAPSGQSIRLFDRVLNKAGQPTAFSVFGSCYNQNDDGVPGCPATYTVVNSGGASWTATNVTNRTPTPCAGYSGPCLTDEPNPLTGAPIPANYFNPIEYNSVDPFSNLLGADLNGVWSLRISDFAAIDDGFLESWTLEFPQSCYSMLESKTPKINSLIWTKKSADAPDLPSQNVSSVPVVDPGPGACPSGGTCVGNQLINNVTIGPFRKAGSYLYELTATDEFGCVFKKDFRINVDTCPPCSPLNFVVPVFSQIPPVCKDSFFLLPTTSSNGVVGIWSPSVDPQKTTTYTFTPLQGQCASTTTMTVQVVNCSPLTIIVSKVNGQCGNIVEIPVRVSGFRNILSMQGSINWSPNDLRFETISGFGAISLGMNTSNFGITQTAQGRLSFSWNDGGGNGITLPDTTTIFTIRFTALGTQSRVVPVSISSIPVPIEFADNNFETRKAILVNGNVNLNCIVTIAGRVITPLQQGVPRATVAINGTGVSKSMLTDINGNYLFRELSGTYTLTPSKNNEVNKMNGITTLDIALIQAHILQRTFLNSPYKIIAADANGSNTVTTVDLSHIRRIILGYDTSFPGNRTWAFVPLSHSFPNPQNPFPYPSSITLTTFNDIFNVNFIGMKIADVNYDRNPTLDRRSEQESVLRLYYEQSSENSYELILSIKVKEGRELMGTQFTLGWDKDQWSYAGIINNKLGIYTGDRWVNEGLLALSWNDAQSQGVALQTDQELFAIRLQRKTPAPFSSDILKLGSEPIEKEAFDASYRKMNITLERRGSTNMQTSAGLDYLKIYPNPVRDVLQINYGAAAASKGEIRLLDMQGRMVYSRTIGIAAGENRYDLNLSNTVISAGSYVLKLKSENTEQQVKVVVVR